MVFESAQLDHFAALSKPLRDLYAKVSLYFYSGRHLLEKKKRFFLFYVRYQIRRMMSSKNYFLTIGIYHIHTPTVTMVYHCGSTAAKCHIFFNH